MRKLLSLIVLSVLGMTMLMAQVKKVTGTVISAEDGEPVIGASVMIVGTQMGVMTDVEGNFTLTDIPSDATTLEIKFMGLKTQRVAIKSKLNIVLESAVEVLTDVVVTGMAKVDKRLFTGASTKLSNEEMKIAGVADVSRSLEGRAAGVSVQNVSGTFGTAPKIRVRGATSIYGSSKPLWVVDGVIMEDVTEVSADQLSSGDANTLISSAIAGLNSDDIESFDILKDGSATSIYGARAMAGVIVITTKKGKAGQSHISYTGEYSMRLKPSYRTFNIMNSQDQMGVYQELQQKGYLNYAEISNAASSGVYGKMYQLITERDPLTGEFYLPNTAEAKADYLRAAEYRNTDWFDKLFTNNIQQNHSVSISTGTEKSQTYASISAMYDPGWTKQSKVSRYTGNFNNTYHISKKVTFTMIGNMSYRKQRAPGTLSSETDVVTGEVHRSFDINPYSYALNTSRALDADTYYTRNYAPFNIFHELNNNYIDLGVFDTRVQGELKVKPITKIELTVLGAYKYNGSTQEHHVKDDSNQAQAYRASQTTVIRDNNPFLYKDQSDDYAVPVSALSEGGIYNKTTNKMNSWDFRATGSYNDEFDESHIVNLYAGMELNSIDRNNDRFRGWGELYDLGEISQYDYRMFKKGQEENSKYFELKNTHLRRVAFFGMATYSWKSRYTLNGTLRYEGSNKLGRTRSARWLPTWNVSSAWNAHEEEWFNDLCGKVLSHATLKGSYSLTAESGPDFVSNSLIYIEPKNFWRPSTSVSETGLIISDVANSGLTYEKKHELNFGADLGFLDNRINVEFDWYKRDNYDLIGKTYTQLKGEKYGNVASMKSNGVELSISTTNIKKKDFSWTTNFVYSHTHNEVTKLDNFSRVIDLVSGSGFALVGYPVRSLFSIPFQGLDNEGLPTFINQSGEVTVTDINFQERENVGFLKYSGNVDPTDVGSLGNIFRYKNFTLNLFVTYSFGNVVRLDPVFKNTYNDLNSMPKEFANRWEVPGDEKVTTIPVIASRRQNKNDNQLSYAYNAYNYSTERIAKGDFIRMKEISLGYEMPKTITSAMNISNMSFKLQATNLFLIYADKKLNGQDPEFFNTGGVAVPMPKQFTLTLKVGI